MDTDQVAQSLSRMGLIDSQDEPVFTPLRGGVSSDIVCIELGPRRICAKQALEQLKVAADWQVSVERNQFEMAWLKTAGAIEPACVPKVLGHDDRLGLLVMEYLDPTQYPVWKSRLFEGEVNAGFAHETGRALAAIHSGTAYSGAVAEQFASDPHFFAIRLEPFFVETARRHPELAQRLQALAEAISGRKICLVHGDVSPKNILEGPSGPVFIDAECAWFGDPAFDVAFCAHHLLLKALALPAHRPGLKNSVTRFITGYLDGVDWESPHGLDRRTAKLVPALMLARVDGKSPVDYLSAREKDRVRGFTSRRLDLADDTLSSLFDDWLDICDNDA